MEILERAGIQGTYINIIKAIHSKPTANIKLNEEKKLKTIPLKSGIRQSCPLSSYLFNVVPEVLARVTRQQKEYKLERKKSKYYYLQMT